MNISEAMKIKRRIQDSCGIDSKMIDLPIVGFVLSVERNSIDVSSYKLLADFAVENNLSLQLEIGAFIISDRVLPPR